MLYGTGSNASVHGRNTNQLTPNARERLLGGVNGRDFLRAHTSGRLPRDGDTVTVDDSPLAWHAVDTTEYNLNLYHFAYALGKPTSNVLFWAITVVNSPREMTDVRLAIGSNAASVWWVNGKEVIAIYNDRQTVIDDGVSKRLTLQKGPNIVRAAIVNAGGATDFCARFLDPAYRPINDLTVALANR